MKFSEIKNKSVGFKFFKYVFPTLFLAGLGVSASTDAMMGGLNRDDAGLSNNNYLKNSQVEDDINTNIDVINSTLGKGLSGNNNSGMNSVSTLFEQPNSGWYSNSDVPLNSDVPFNSGAFFNSGASFNSGWYSDQNSSILLNNFNERGAQSPSFAANMVLNDRAQARINSLNYINSYENLRGNDGPGGWYDAMFNAVNQAPAAVVDPQFLNIFKNLNFGAIDQVDSRNNANVEAMMKSILKVFIRAIPVTAATQTISLKTLEEIDVLVEKNFDELKTAFEMDLATVADVGTLRELVDKIEGTISGEFFLVTGVMNAYLERVVVECAKKSGAKFTHLINGVTAIYADTAKAKSINKATNAAMANVAELDQFIALCKEFNGLVTTKNTFFDTIDRNANAVARKEAQQFFDGICAQMFRTTSTDGRISATTKADKTGPLAAGEIFANTVALRNNLETFAKTVSDASVGIVNRPKTAALLRKQIGTRTPVLQMFIKLYKFLFKPYAEAFPNPAQTAEYLDANASYYNVAVQQLTAKAAGLNESLFEIFMRSVNGFVGRGATYSNISFGQIYTQQEAKDLYRTSSAYKRLNDALYNVANDSTMNNPTARTKFMFMLKKATEDKKDQPVAGLLTQLTGTKKLIGKPASGDGIDLKDQMVKYLLLNKDDSGLALTTAASVDGERFISNEKGGLYCSDEEANKKAIAYRFLKGQSLSKLNELKNASPVRIDNANEVGYDSNGVYALKPEAVAQGPNNWGYDLTPTGGVAGNAYGGTEYINGDVDVFLTFIKNIIEFEQYLPTYTALTGTIAAKEDAEVALEINTTYKANTIAGGNTVVARQGILEKLSQSFVKTFYKGGNWFTDVNYFDGNVNKATFDAQNVLTPAEINAFPYKSGDASGGEALLLELTALNKTLTDGGAKAASYAASDLFDTTKPAGVFEGLSKLVQFLNLTGGTYTTIEILPKVYKEMMGYSDDEYNSFAASGFLKTFLGALVNGVARVLPEKVYRSVMEPYVEKLNRRAAAIEFDGTGGLGVKGVETLLANSVTANAFKTLTEDEIKSAEGAEFDDAYYRDSMVNFAEDQDRIGLVEQQNMNSSQINDWISQQKFQQEMASNHQQAYADWAARSRSRQFNNGLNGNNVFNMLGNDFFTSGYAGELNGYYVDQQYPMGYNQQEKPNVAPFAFDEHLLQGLMPGSGRSNISWWDDHLGSGLENPFEVGGQNQAAGNYFNNQQANDFFGAGGQNQAGNYFNNQQANDFFGVGGQNQAGNYFNNQQANDFFGAGGQNQAGNYFNNQQANDFFGVGGQNQAAGNYFNNQQANDFFGAGGQSQAAGNYFNNQRVNDFFGAGGQNQGEAQGADLNRTGFVGRIVGLNNRNALSGNNMLLNNDNTSISPVSSGKAASEPAQQRSVGKAPTIGRLGNVGDKTPAPFTLKEPASRLTSRL